MNPSQRHLIAIDLDDTILSAHFSLNTDSVKTLIDCQEAGHVVMIATARPEALALPYHRILHLRGPISTLNGAYLYHPDDPAFPVFSDLISAETTAAISDAAHDLGIKRIWFEINDHCYAVGDPDPAFHYFKEIFRVSGASYHDRLPALPAARIYACADTKKPIMALDALIAARGDCATRYYVSQNGEHRLNINAATADKWFAVKRAADHYGIPNENIITFGDALNDKDMIFSAGHGFVMCNGNKNMIEEAQKKGIGVTKYPCHEGGVGFELRELLGKTFF